MQADVDEYLLNMGDTREGFLYRWVKNKNPNKVSQYKVSIILMDWVWQYFDVNKMGELSVATLPQPQININQ